MTWKGSTTWCGPKGRGGFNVFDPKRLRYRWRYGFLAELAARMPETDEDEVTILRDEHGYSHRAEIKPRSKAS